jgi:membrane protein implicated in regulation of membrane protease activity
VLLFLVSPFLLWLALPKETLPSLRRWSGKWIVYMSVFMALLQAFVLARFLGIVSPSDLSMARGGSVTIGIIFMIIGNITPKMPVAPRRYRFQPDPWTASRMLRFGGKLFVGLGLAFVLGGILLPLEYWEPVFTSLMLAALAAGVWYSIKLRHERSLQ